MRYMQVSGNDRNPALCSDDNCPCGFPGAQIPRGAGYLYISQEVVDFRSDCPTEAEAQAKIQRMAAQLGAMIFAGSGVFAPILMCEQGARKRGLDLEVAAADAKHWWNTGQAPLRPTPLAGAQRPAAASKPASPAATAKPAASKPASPAAASEPAAPKPAASKPAASPAAASGPAAAVRKKKWWQFWR